MKKAILDDGIKRELNTCRLRADGAVSVTWFGADPEGVCDSTDAIERAHSAGKTVYYPDGTYIFNGEQLDMSHGVIFQSRGGVLVRNLISDEPVIVFDELGNLVGLRQGHLETGDGDCDDEITSGSLVPPPLSKACYRRRAELMVHFYNDFGKRSTLYQPGWKGWYSWAWNYHGAGTGDASGVLKYHAERNPLLGFYRGDDAVVLDWICYWLAEYGAAGVFITAGDLETWEDPRASDHWVWQLFNRVPNFRGLKYGMTMPGWFRESAGEEDLSYTRAAIRALWDRVLELTYFSPEHKNAYTMKINGGDYPVLFLFEENYLTYMLDGYSGTDGCFEFLAEMSEKFREHGFPGFSLIIRQRKGRLTDEFTGMLERYGVYIFTGYYEQGFIGDEAAAPGTTYGEMVDGMAFPESFDGRIAHVFTGANTLGPHPSRWRHPGNTPELFEKMLEKAVRYIERSDAPGLITCYNVSEWSEGGPGLQPNMKDGFGYLDACYNVLIGENGSVAEKEQPETEEK